MKNPNISLIITTYNWPDALSLCLKTVLKQNFKSFELIIADDGSTDETAQAVKKVLTKSKIKWIHVRHDDNGIRQARIKNLAVKYSSAPYLIFIDHDVPLHPCFIEDHFSMAEKGCFLQGKRAFLSEKHSQKIFEEEFFTPPNIFYPGLENRKNALRLPAFGKFFARKKTFQTSLRGCNISMSKENFLMVDGYDETFDQLWGREDSDICYRLFHNDIKIKNLWFMANQYHLFHNVIKNKKKDRLDEELELICKEKRKKALKGYSMLSSEGGHV